MQFVSDYLKAIDIIPLAALVAIAGASLYRGGTIWLLIAAIVVAIWGVRSVVWSLLTNFAFATTWPSSPVWKKSLNSYEETLSETFVLFESYVYETRTRKS